MTDEALRKACEAWIIGNSPYIPREDELGCVDSLVAFAKRQRAAALERAANEVQESFVKSGDNNPAVALITQAVIDFLREQRAKELE